jgi:ribonuclease HI
MPKFYVVWEGREIGIFDKWEKCRASIEGHKGGLFKSFKTLEAAKKAFQDGYALHWGHDKSVNNISEDQRLLIGEPAVPSVSVDAAWNTGTGDMEYRGVDTDSGIQIFHQGPFQDGTNNVGEFLAIVHGLAYLKKQGSTIPVYSDSRNAINWVKDKKHYSLLEPTANNQKIFELLARAEKWLQENGYENEVLKWETRAWGKNPADFGRK